MKKLITASLLFAYFYCDAQITFQKTYGGATSDRGNYVQQTTDGGYIVTGSHASNYDDIYLTRMDINGNLMWTKTFGGGGNDVGYSVQQTTDGGYIITGYTPSITPNNTDVCLIKTDANGDTLWSKTYGKSSDFDEGRSVQQTTDGGYIITGFYGSAFGNHDVYLIKTDANGDTLWTKKYGSAGNQEGNSVQQTLDGGYIIAGNYVSNTTNAYLIKTNANGDTLWTKTFGGPSYVMGNSVQQTSDGGYILVGNRRDFSNLYDILLIRTDTIGNLLWTKTYGETSGDDFGWSVRSTSDGGYIVSGYTELSQPYVIKTDAIGDTLWTKSYGTGIGGGIGTKTIFAQQTSDGGYIIGGTTSHSPSDIYLIKTDSLGNSGCIDNSPQTIVNIPAAITTPYPTTVASTSSIVATVPIFIDSAGVATTLCATGIDPISNFPLPISISPNPTANNFTIVFPSEINKGRIEITNILGKNVLKENISKESEKEINLKNISQGIYFVKVFDGEKSYCKKLIVEHD